MILDGKALATRIKLALTEETASFKAATGVTPCLATVLVGEDPASAVYVRSKIKSCAAIGYESRHYHLPSATTEQELVALVEELNADPEVHGILVQLPLPKDVDSDAVIDAIALSKDVDGFHPRSMGHLALKKPGFVSCTPAGIMRLLEESGLDPSGKKAVVVGRSAIVGLPAALLLTHANATVTVCHSRTTRADLEAAVREADIVVAAVGSPHFVPGAWVKRGAVVIDVGINRVADPDRPRGRLVGDVEFDTAVERAGWITPVPGGVGPMTIAMLMSNTLLAAQRATAR
jgi:methylenetetrahydrofolate dehydrogenase (NADP+)/methenyltetrahydrofolate cyclohydrolase